MTDNGSIGFQNNGIKERFCYCREKARNQESDSIIPYSVDFEASAKLMISIGGHDNFQHFSAMVCRPEMQKTFIQAIISFITDNRLDGVDIFWKWPTETERFKYTDFIKELKGSMSIVNKNFILSIVAPPAGIDGWENGFDLDHTCNGSGRAFSRISEARRALWITMDHGRINGVHQPDQHLHYMEEYMRRRNSMWILRCGTTSAKQRLLQNSIWSFRSTQDFGDTIKALLLLEKTFSVI
ncbi:Protein CBG02713 [Caenorhabditis briggsae]|uniref:Protein CBG02713 n=1 Tax=Caenorhabditis briggsae TaxID=6238 RepID=A8WTN9_CAEBR|nr:Protein CBG02713 [Caenorhabditis briggsae]CAP23851.2 Protein CBG02713 [Caenorhabditis briggsae]